MISIKKGKNEKNNKCFFISKKKNIRKMFFYGIPVHFEAIYTCPQMLWLKKFTMLEPFIHIVLCPRGSVSYMYSSLLSLEMPLTTFFLPGVSKD